jgi:cobalt-zinc-cadmium resistance protein CzcA
MQMAIKPGSSLQESIAASTKAERILKENFPEVKHVVSKIGTAEIPTDPMAIEDADIMIILKDKKEWTTADNREDLADAMKEKLSDILGAQFEFTQPIQLRFNELLSGAKADIAVKIYGEDHEELHNLGLKAGGLFKNIDGAADVKVEQTEGLPQLLLRFNREKMSRYGVHVTQINRVVRSAFAGETAGTVFEGEKRFDLVLRLDSVHRFSGKIDQLSVRSATGENIPLRELVEVSYESGPMQISRDNAQRRIAIGINVRNRDMGSLVEEIQQIMETKMNLPPGYSYKVGGQYENFVNASQRLMIAVPLALLLIVVLLFFAFQSVKYALLIFTAVPLSAVGGIAALLIRDMPFSISAGVGFIALFGVAVLNGIVLISHINSLKSSADLNLTEIITQGAGDRLRPVLMTAAVAIMGFTPMALSNGAGAEVQKPLATVVIGGLITATFLTMVVLPSLLLLLERGIKLKKELITLAALFAFAPLAQAQNAINREQVIDSAFANNPEWLNAGLESEQATVRRQTAVELNPLSVQYQQGQIDGPERTDYTLSIEQDFGSLLTHMRRASELNTREQLAQAAVQLKARELKYEVLLKYENWVYAQERFLLAKKEFDVFKKLEEKLENQYKAGEISALELNRSRNQLYQFYALLLREEQNFRQATRDIYDIALLDKLYQPAQTNLEPLLLQPDSSLSAILLEPSSLAVQAGEKAAKSLAGDFFPAINAGYYKLRLDPYTNLGAFSVGITIPLWFVPQNSRVKEAQIEVMKRNNEFFALQKRYQNALQLQWAAYANYRLRWQESITDALKSANDLQKQAEESFLRGETDYLNLAVSIETAIMLKFTYLENLFLMNQHGIKLQFLVDQN